MLPAACLQYERKLEAARDLRALLRLLGHATQRDLSDSTDGGSRQAVSEGAEHVMGTRLRCTACSCLVPLPIRLPTACASSCHAKRKHGVLVSLVVVYMVFNRSSSGVLLT